MHSKTIHFQTYSSIRIGPKVDVYIVEDTKDMKDFSIIGGANNLLVGPNPPKLMMLSKKYDYIYIKENKLHIGGATPSGKIASFCKKNNIANFEFLSHLPGKLGGLVFMNAGLKEYEIANHLIDITLQSGKKQKNEINFQYRKTDINEMIFEATFSLQYGYDQNKVKMFHAMRKNQPSIPSAGSCFKNPPNDYAGRLIEAVGLKGKKVGDMAFSTQHANFLVNYGNGTFEDAIFLIQEAKKRVKEHFNIDLECEIQILEKGLQL